MIRIVVLVDASVAADRQAAAARRGAQARLAERPDVRAGAAHAATLLPAVPSHIPIAAVGVSVVGSTQVPPQFTKPVAHDSWHVPLLQTLLPVHGMPWLSGLPLVMPVSFTQLPDAPQYVSLVAGSMQVSPSLQSTSPD